LENYAGLPSKFFALLDYEECRSWVDELYLTLKSRRTVRDYAEAFMQFVEFTGKNPRELARLSYEEAYRLMKRFALWRFRRKGVSAKRVKAQWFALVSFFRFHRVKGDFRFPSKNIPVTVKYLDKIPTREELARIMNAPKVSLSTKIAIQFMAYAGLRPEDLTKLTYACIKRDFEEGVIPCAVYVPQEKTGNIYVTFIPEETVNLLKQYFEERRKSGEKITDRSPIILDEKVKGGKPVSRVNLCKRILRAMRKSGVEMEEDFAGKIRRMRPYSLRKYFRSNLTGHMPNEYIEAMMGHVSGLNQVYGGTRDLDPSTIERMREAYKKCIPFLTATSQPLDQNMVVKQAKIEALKSIARTLFGIDLLEVKVAKEKEEGRELTVDEQIQLFENELKKLRENPDPQKIVSEDELEEYLRDGWEFVSVLPSNRILIRKDLRLRFQI